MDVNTVQDGGGKEYIKLGNIGDVGDIHDIYTIASASIVGINIAIAFARLGNLGGLSLNAFFDTFGLEGFLATMFLILIFMQLARWVYTVFYTAGGKREWSPFIFVCIVLLTQVVHDIFFYYGVIDKVPYGENSLVDSLKRYVTENGGQSMGGHAAFLILVSVLSMIFKEISGVLRIFISCLSLYLLPFLISAAARKKTPPPPTKEQVAAMEAKAKEEASKQNTFAGNIPKNAFQTNGWMNSPGF